MQEPQELKCTDCGCAIGKDSGPPDGWQLEDGRTVCQRCCIADLRRVVDQMQRDIEYLTGEPD